MLFHGLPGLEMEVGGSVGLIQRGSGGSSVVVMEQFCILNIVADIPSYTRDKIAWKSSLSLSLSYTKECM